MSLANYRKGLLAETIAAFFFKIRGYRILARRYKTPVGEIDLVVKGLETVIFVEVKSRACVDAALETLSPPHARARVVRAARHFLMRHPELADRDLRFDVFAYASPLRWRHLDNAWQVDP